MFRNKSGLAMIQAIVSKDLLAAIKNRTILTTIITFSLALSLYFIGPSLLGDDDLPGLVMVGQQTDPLVTDMLRNPTFNLIRVSSVSEMESVLGQNSEPLLGIPSQPVRTTSDQTILINGYMDHWVSEDQIMITEQFFEDVLSRWADQQIDLIIQHDQVFTQLDGAHPFNLTFPMVALFLFLGISIAPNLILDEKEARTLDMLLTSPATIGQIIIGKAIVAVLYGSVAALVLFALNNALVTHWHMAILASVLGAIFTSALGLLMGVLLDNRQQVIVWSQVVLITLLLPVFVHAILQGTTIGFWLEFVPTVALGTLIRVALSSDTSISIVLPELLWLLLVTSILLLLVGWLVKRSQNES